MENSIQTHNRIFLLVLVTIVLSVASIFVPFLYLIVPALYAVILIRSNNPVLAIPLFCPALLAGLILSDGTVFSSTGIQMYSMILGGILAGITIWQVEKRDKGCFYTAALACACFILGLYCAVCLPGVLSGEGAFSEIQNAFSESMEAFKEAVSTVPAEEYPGFQDTVSSTADTLVASVPLFTVPGIIVTSCVTALSNTLFFRLLIKNHREALGISPMLPFRSWSVPKSLTPGLIILLLGTLILNLTDSSVYEAVSISVSALIGFPFLLQAICLIEYLIYRSKSGHALKRVLIYTACAVFTSFLLSPLIMIGCFEQLFRLRERMDARGQKSGTSGSGGTGV